MVKTTTRWMMQIVKTLIARRYVGAASASSGSEGGARGVARGKKRMKRKRLFSRLFLVSISIE